MAVFFTIGFCEGEHPALHITIFSILEKSQHNAGFPLLLVTLVTDENKTSTGESKTPAIVT
jgi:hypothetical protein